MKKIFYLLLITFLCVFGFNSFAQESSTYDASLGYESTYRIDALSSSDSIGVGDSIWFYTVKKLTKGMVKTSFRVAYDSIGGTGDSVLTTVLYKRWLNDPWTEDYRFVYYGTVDTAITVDLDTARTADYWRIHVKGYSDGFQMLIDSVYFKFTE